MRSAPGSVVSAKTLIRLFRDHVGLPPETTARLVRFEAALRLLRASGPGEGALVAAEAGYADQAHFVRELTSFAGTSPDAWPRKPDDAKSDHLQ